MFADVKGGRVMVNLPYQSSLTLFTNALPIIYFPGDHKLNCIGSLLTTRLMFMTAYIVFLLNLIVKSSSVKESVFHFFTTCKLRMLFSLDKIKLMFRV